MQSVVVKTSYIPLPLEKQPMYAPNQTSFIMDLFSKRIDMSDDPDRPFYIINLDDIGEKYRLWKHLLPRVIPYYAVKSNPDLEIVRELAALGTNFDCASMGEIKLLQSLGISTERILFAHPQKPPSHIAYAREHGVNFTVFDSQEELLKVHEIHPNTKLLLRVRVDDSFSVCPLGAKFGANLKDVEDLLHVAKELGLNVVGVSFHVGSGCFSAQAYEKAFLSAKDVFNIAEQQGFHFEVLDIGGGFPGTWGQELVSFPSIAAVISPLLDKLFSSDVSIIAEPGRYFCCSCSTLVTRVVGKREEECEGETSVKYYLNDGVYGSFNCVLYDHYTPVPIPLKDVSQVPTMKTTMYGPTCDSIDKMIQDYQFPRMCIGDYIYFANMGAYTKAAGSEFNGFQSPKVFYLRPSEFQHM
eukprot:TRINITY_DN228_c0_g1_i2.p1 TRINITY_DN228_c0_g1~~TRINITY_DN228_c0_g1_i2.p1  ORF type:complete len:412 (-),score=64.97 TRINITY_DN228_c0_g1_i2:70-1305(-)